MTAHYPKDGCPICGDTGLLWGMWTCHPPEQGGGIKAGVVQCDNGHFYEVGSDVGQLELVQAGD